jgi:hypothetical protein
MRYGMTPENLIQEYLSALEKSDVNKIFQLFKEDAIVVSPLYGEIKASNFYPELFEDTLASKITLKDIYYSCLFRWIRPLVPRDTVHLFRR